MNLKMNPAQKVLAMLVLMRYYNELGTSFTSKEHEFVRAVRESELEHFRTEHASYSGEHKPPQVKNEPSEEENVYDDRGKPVLKWSPSFLKNMDMVACPIDEEGFHFSQMQKYKHSNKSLKGHVDQFCPPAELKLLEKEIEKIKKIFLAYDSGIGKYFH
jgi:hypothetical protein